MYMYVCVCVHVCVIWGIYIYSTLQSGSGYYNLAVPGQDKAAPVPMPRLGGVVPPPPSSGILVEDEDYMNEVPEGVFHTYSNHKELLEQVRLA